MSKSRASGPRAKALYTYLELPIGSTSIGVHKDVIKTGIWRVQRPVFATKTPPCNQACPAGVDARGFITRMSQGRFAEALDLYLVENPFPAICGRVCYHPCEAVCNRKGFDQAVAINALERYLAAFDPPKLPQRPMDGGRVAVIGSGPAGLSSAHFLARLGHRVTVFEALDVLGGLLRTGIPDYRLPGEIVEAEVEKLRAFGIEFRTQHPISDRDWHSLNQFDAVVLAHGAGQQRSLPFEAPPRARQKVLSGLEFLKTVKLGGDVPLGHQVAVIGGGNTAIDVARVALRLGASPTIIYRRSAAEMPAFREEVNDALAEGVKVLYLTSPLAVLETEFALQVRCIKNRLGEPGADGRPRPEPIAGSEFLINADTVIVAIGETPNLSFLPRGIALSNGMIRVDELGSTRKAGAFAVGDVIDQPRTVAHAIGSGKRVAIAIDCYLRDRPAVGLATALAVNEGVGVSFRSYLEGNLRIESQKGIGFEGLNPSYFQREERIERPRISAAKAQTSFEEVYGGLSLDEALSDAGRCLNCGTCVFCDNCYLFCPDASVLKPDDAASYRIDYDFCKGCGICATECPIGFIDMVEEE